MAEDDDGIVLQDGRSLPAGAISWKFGPSGGPGGQHANRSNTRAEALLDVSACTALSELERRRVTEAIGPLVRVVVDESRSQKRNRAKARERLGQRIDDALRIPPARRPTRISRGADEARLDTKRRRAELKRSRGWRGDAP